MEGCCVLFCVVEAFAFDGFDVEDHRSVEVSCFSEELDELWEVVAVDRADGDEAQVFEPVAVVCCAWFLRFDALGDHGLCCFACAVVCVCEDAAAREVLEDFACVLFEVCVHVAEAYAVEVLCERALWFGDAHAVVVEDDEHLTFERAGVVESFHGEAVDDGGVADECDDSSSVWVCAWVEGFVVERVSACHADGG